MNVSILTTTSQHPIHDDLVAWAAGRTHDHVTVHTDPDDVGGGDVLFLVSCKHIVGPVLRSRFRATLIVHASDLPKGRGMSPHVWQILEGVDTIVVSLLEAEDVIDTGRIWAQRRMQLDGHELFDEINDQLFDASFSLMDEALDDFDRIEPRSQVGEPSALYRTRTPSDSEIDPNASIAEQFDLLRVADPDRFPAFFTHRGQRYTISIRKATDPIHSDADSISRDED